MILSVSRRTDVPALYARWFEHRLAAGYCRVPNPFNPRQVARVSLAPEDVDAFVFWTRHPRPFLDLLPQLDARGYRYYFQFTITGYGRPLEARTPPLATAIDTFRDLARRRPPGSVVWRYDPILIGKAMPADDHVRRFRRIASALEGSTDRVVVSYVDPYRKTRRRVGRFLEWGVDLEADVETWPGRHALLASLAAVAREFGMQIEACAEAEDYSSIGVPATKCVDDRLLARLYGGAWAAKKDPGQRDACRCIPSRDIGVPGTCTMGCAYCYATRSDEAARRRRAAHDPAADTLGAPSV